MFIQQSCVLLHAMHAVILPGGTNFIFSDRSLRLLALDIGLWINKFLHLIRGDSRGVLESLDT